MKKKAKEKKPISHGCSRCNGKGVVIRQPDGLLYAMPCPECGSVDKETIQNIEHWT